MVQLTLTELLVILLTAILEITGGVVSPEIATEVLPEQLIEPEPEPLSETSTVQEAAGVSVLLVWIFKLKLAEELGLKVPPV